MNGEFDVNSHYLTYWILPTLSGYYLPKTQLRILSTAQLNMNNVPKVPSYLYSLQAYDI